MTELLNRFADTPFISLETYRKDGRPIATPLWCGTADGRLLVWTPRDSMKVRRLRRNAAARVAACNASGKKLLGAWSDVTVAIFEDPASIAAARGAIRAKYGWQLTLVEKTMWMRGRKASEYIALELRPRGA